MDRCKTAAETEETLDIIAPFMPRAVMTELCSGRLYQDYRERKREQQLAAVNYGIWYQQNVIAPVLAKSASRSVDGFRWLGTIAEELSQSARTKYGRDCWNDPDFVRHTFKHTPEARAPKAAPRFVVVDGLRDRVKARGAHAANKFQTPGRSDDPARSDRNTGAANGRSGGDRTGREPSGENPLRRFILKRLPAHETKRAPDFCRNQSCFAKATQDLTEET